MSQTKAELIEPQGNVAFDTNTLYVDATNNRVGLGTSTFPSSGKLQVTGSNASTSVAGVECVTLLDGDANNEFNILNFATSAGGTIARIGAKATTTGAYPSSVGELHFAVQNGASTNTALVIDSSSRVGVGTTSPGDRLHVVGPTAGISARFSDGVNATLAISHPSSGTSKVSDYGGNYGLEFASASLNLLTAGSERARIDSSGRLLVGTSSARSNFYNSTATSLVQFEGTGGGGSASQASLALINNSSSAGDSPYLLIGRSKGSTIGSNTVISSGDSIGRVSFQASDGAEFVEAASIEAFVDGTPGANDMPGRLVFSTTADGASSPTERMRITNNGAVRIGATNAANAERFYLKGNATDAAATIHQDTTSSITQIFFLNPNGNVGSITTSGSATAYNTSSDYRLKENVEPVTNGIARLQQLKPSRFNFIADPDKTVDGFIAHEVQAIVPEAVTGEKDAVDDKGNPIYQGIDQSKLVPLLTAALQEAVAKIESLETRLTAAGI